MTSPFSLQGKTVFVTGASSGIGKATAIECSKMGATLIITGRNKERLNDTFLSLNTSFGQEHKQMIADLTKKEDLKNLCDTLPVLQGVVLNAGAALTLPCQFVTEEKLDSLLKINTYAPILLSCSLLKNKKIAKGASVVFVSSIGDYKVTSPGEALYSTSKASLIGFARTFALEVAGKNIRANTVCPGVIDTAIFSCGTITKEQLEENKKLYPLKRHGKAQEVAWGIIYLLSEASSFVTGSNLVIDGGLTLK